MGNKSKSSNRSQSTKVIALALVVVLITIGGSAITLKAFALLPFSSLIPGPEGVRCINYGFQTGITSQVYKASAMDPLPSGWLWTDNQPSNMVVSKNGTAGDLVPIGLQISGPSFWYQKDGGEIRSEIQHPVLRDEPGGLGSDELTYYKYVQRSDGSVEIRKVVVYLIPVDFIIGMSDVPGKGAYTFQGTQLWYSLDAVTWMNAYKSMPPADPNPLTNDTTKYLSSSTRGMFPIIAWISGYQDAANNPKYTSIQGLETGTLPDPNIASFVQLTPSLQGRFIDLYTSPSSTYDLGLSADVVGNSELLEQALSPSNMPDPRFQSTVYFKITLNSFGAYIKPTGILGSFSSYEVWHPSVQYRVRALYAVSGEYVYLWTAKAANDSGYSYDPPDETWQPRNDTVLTYTDPITGWFNWLGQSWRNWWANPINWLALFLMVGMITAVVVIIFLLYVGAVKLRGSRSGKKGRTSVKSAAIILLIMISLGVGATVAGSYIWKQQALSNTPPNDLPDPPVGWTGTNYVLVQREFSDVQRTGAAYAHPYFEERDYMKVETWQNGFIVSVRHEWTNWYPVTPAMVADNPGEYPKTWADLYARQFPDIFRLSFLRLSVQLLSALGSGHAKVQPEDHLTWQMVLEGL